MANQLKMADISAILALHGHGWSDRRIAREQGICREMVGRYVRSAADQAKPANAPPGSTVVNAGGSVESPPPEDGGPVPADNSKPASTPPGSGGELAGAADPKPANAPPGSTVLTDVSPRDLPAPRERGQHSAARPWRDLIIRKLDQGLCARRIHQDLQTDQGYTGSYYSVRRLVRKLSAIRSHFSQANRGRRRRRDLFERQNLHAADNGTSFFRKC